MTRGDDIQRLILAVHALTRTAALTTANETPSAQWRTLRLLRDYGPQRLGELARLSRISQPGMTRLIGQLAEAGMVTRTSDAADSRATVIAPTGRGLEVLEAWLHELQAALEPLLADLDHEEWDAVRTAGAALARTTGMLEVAR